LGLEYFSYILILKVGGMFTTNCVRYLSLKGIKTTLVTPGKIKNSLFLLLGNNKTEILRIVKALGSLYEQVVLLGYPPFVKDVVDTGVANKLDWNSYNIKMVFAGCQKKKFSSLFSRRSVQ
jgi:phenylacetate-CoA ligase